MTARVSGAESLRGFTVAVKKFSEKFVPDQIRAFQKYLALKLFRLILQKTPVDTGALRGAWTVSIGEPSSASAINRTLQIVGKKKNQRALPEEIQQMQSVMDQISSMKLGTVIWFSNSMPYVLRIEFGGHSGVKAPQGMVRVSLEEIISWAQSRPVFSVTGKGE